MKGTGVGVLRLTTPSALILSSAIFIASLFSAQCLGAAGKPQSAATQAAAPQDSQLSAARALLQEGHLDQAESAVREFLKTHPDSADAHFLLGLILFRQTQRASTPSDIYNDPSKAELEFRQQKARESLAEFTEGAKYRDPGAFDLKIVALNYVLFGDYSNADKWLTRSVSWDPRDVEAWYYLGRTKYNENRFEEAIHAFQQCLKLEPRNVKAQDNLGLSLVGLNRVPEAIAAFRAAIQWQEKPEASSSGAQAEAVGSAAKLDVGPYIDLGNLFLDQNRMEDALPVLLRAVEIAPDQSKSHELLGKAYSLLGDLPKAQAELEAAVRLSPRTAHLHFMLGQVYRRQGLTEKAKAEFDQMSKLNKNAQAAPPGKP